MVTFSKTRVSLAQIDVTPNYRPSSFSQIVPALVTGIALLQVFAVEVYIIWIDALMQQCESFILSGGVCV